MMEEIKSCTGATDQKRMEGKELAVFVVYQEGYPDYYAMKMNADQRTERRIYMRKALLSYPEWANLSNEELDRVRIQSVKGGYLAERPYQAPTFLPFDYISREDTEFRKVRAMMPFDFLNMTAKDFLWDKYSADTSGSKSMMNQYIINYQAFKAKGMGLYIYSETKGSGKTMLACCLLNEIAKRYAGSFKFVNILDFIEMTKKGIEGQDEGVKSIYQAGLLVIDDIGVQMSREWIDTVLYRLINDRYVNKLPTIYTSNLPVEGLKIDDRVTDRIECTTYPIRLPDESIRKIMRQQEKQELLNNILDKK